MEDLAHQHTPHELEVQSTDQTQYPYIKMRGVLGLGADGNTSWNKATLAKVHDVDSGGAIEYAIGTSLRKEFSGGSVALGTTDDHPMVAIDVEHKEIHESEHYFYSDSVELGSAATQDYMLTTPNTTKWIHMTMAATGSAITQVQVYEDGDRTGTTLQTSYNNNRNSSNTTGLVIHKATSGGTTDGTLIWQMKSGAAQGASREGMNAGRGDEFIMKQNKKYIIRITSGTAANLTNLQLSWYDHTIV
jgi:hypothetical protein